MRKDEKQSRGGDRKEDCVWGEGKLIKIFEFQIDDMAH